MRQPGRPRPDAIRQMIAMPRLAATPICTHAARPTEDPAAVSFNDHAQYTAIPTADRARLRYVLVSHDNDGVTKFGADLVTSRPRWLSPGSPPVQEVPGSSPRGVPRDAVAVSHHVPADPHRQRWSSKTRPEHGKETGQ
jgi:hypothetical protein